MKETNTLEERRILLEMELSYLGNSEFENAVKLYMTEHLGDSFLLCPASINYHRQYPGGLFDHCIEVYNIYKGFFNSLKLNIPKHIQHKREMLCVSLLHDVQKIFKYIPDQAPQYIPKIPFCHSVFPIYDFKARTGVDIPDHLANIILSHMGPWTDADRYPQTLFEVLFHAADNASARLNTLKEKRK